MKNSGNRLQVASLVLIFALMPILLLNTSAAQSITMPRMREMATMQDHHSHPQTRQTTPKPSVDEPSNFTFASIDVPGAAGTIATGINAHRAIVGIYYDTAGNSHGFLLKHGNFLTLDVPGSLVGVSGVLQSAAVRLAAASGRIPVVAMAPAARPVLRKPRRVIELTLTSCGSSGWASRISGC